MSITLKQKKKIKKSNSKVLGVVKYPKKIATSYNKSLDDIVDSVKVDIDKLLPDIIDAINLYNLNEGLLDSVDGGFGTIETHVKSVFSDTINKYNSRTDTYTTTAEDFVNSMDEYSQSSIIKMITAKYKKTTPADVILKEAQSQMVSNATVTSIAKNTKLIKSIPNQYLSQVQDIFTDKFSTLVGKSPTETKSLVEQLMDTRFNVTKSRANVIARDQTQKVLADYNNARYTSYGISKGIWKVADTSNRLRESHRVLNNQEYEINVGIMSGGKFIKPAEEVLCRCDVLPVIPDGIFK